RFERSAAFNIFNRLRKNGTQFIQE
ncbi:hypothetical protein KPH14_011870, partial [Odynerus spinipes]